MSVFAAPTDKLSMSIGASIESSNNIYLTPDNTVSDNIFHALMTVDYQKESSVITTRFNLSADNQHYQNNSFPNETVFSSLLDMNGVLIKSHLNWIVRNIYEQVQTNADALNIPTNRENTNYFLTGPNFVFFQNDKDSLNALIEYSRLYTEESDADSSGYIVNAVYHRNITRTFAIGLAANYNSVNFDNEDINTNYNKTDLTVDFTKTMKLSEIRLVLGETSVKKVNAERELYDIFRMNFKSQLGKSTNAGLGFRRELGDFAGTLGSVGGAANVSGDTFVLEEGTVFVDKQVGFSRLNLGFIYTGYDYSNDVSDYDTSAINFIFTHGITTTVNLNFDLNYVDYEYTGVNRSDIEKIYIVGLRKTFRDAYDLALSVKHTNRGSTDPTFNYDETRITLGGNYYFR